ncbi:MAG TPA: RodZ domain-containing protein [Gaiellaceae bacterium]|nr:RodZ domain-containing protein [Gaiellaceae bacterium]
MTAIGSVLRSARKRRGLELDDVHRATQIRPDYLLAIEEDRFEELPGEAYARAFLRGYASVVGIDPAPLLAAYEERFAAPDEEPVPPPPVLVRRASWARRRAAVVAAAVVVAVLIALIAWSPGGGPAPGPAPPRATAHLAAVRHDSRRTVPSHLAFAPAAVHPVSRPRRVEVVLSAARGDCWLLVRRGSASGPVLYEGIVALGQSRRFAVLRPLWIRVGAPWNLDVRLAGRSVAVPIGQPGNVLVGAAGLTVAQ